jgi:hypothetical protein
MPKQSSESSRLHNSILADTSIWSFTLAPHASRVLTSPPRTRFSTMALPVKSAVRVNQIVSMLFAIGTSRVSPFPRKRISPPTRCYFSGFLRALPT